MPLPAVNLDVSHELLGALEQRYHSGELTKNQYLLAKGQLQDKIDRGQAIRRTPFGLALKWLLVAVLLGAAFATWSVLTPGWVAWVLAAALVGLAVWVAITP